MVAVTRTSSAPSILSNGSENIHGDARSRTNYGEKLKEMQRLRHEEDWNEVIAISNEILSSQMSKYRDGRLYAEMFYAMRQRETKDDAELAYNLWKELAASRQAKTLLGPRVYRCVIQLLSRFGMLQQAILARYQGRQMKYTLNRYVYNTYLNLCAKSACMDEAFAALQDMALDSVEPDVVSFNCLIVCCINASDMDMALTLIERMKQWPNIHPDLYSFNSIVNGLCKIGRLDDALAIVARMEIESAHYAKFSHLADPPPPPPPLTPAQLQSFSGNASALIPTPMYCRFAPDVCTYNTLLGALAHVAHPDLRRALRLKLHMQNRGIVLTDVSYNALMATAARANHIREAFSLYQEMLTKGIAPNIECYTTIITLCARSRLVNRAFAIHQHMIASGLEPTVVTFNSLISACRHSADGDRALSVLQDMHFRGGKCTPDVVSYSAVIDALGRAERLPEAIRVFDEMVRFGIQPNAVTYTSLVAAQARVGDLSDAMKTLVEMEDAGIPANVFTFSSLINGAGRVGNFDIAFELLSMMRERKIYPTVVTFVTLVEHAARCSQPRYLHKAIREIGAAKIIGRSSDYESIVQMSKHELICKREGRHLLGRLVRTIRKTARVNAWGSIARAPQMRRSRSSRVVRKTAPLKDAVRVA